MSPLPPRSLAHARDDRHAPSSAGGTTFLCLAADRASTNLAIVRNSVNKHVAALS
ncbi:MAG TPA: hypothetical protein VGQ76_09490 [Thermoanaerobaculia bacterium]|nr:hypothetical protein [Thermoanaerobaculia bacterium]